MNRNDLIAAFVGPCGSVADLNYSACCFDYLTARAYWGFDSSVRCIAAAQSKANDWTKFSTVDVFHFEPGYSFDVCLMIDIAQHQTDPVDAIRKLTNLWRAKRYIFSLLIGYEQRKLSFGNVVTADDAMPLLRESKFTRVIPHDYMQHSWYLLEVHRAIEN